MPEKTPGCIACGKPNI
jgi:hypothetical protein